MPASETTCSVQGKQQSKAAALLFERLCVGSRNALQMCDVAQHLPPAVTMQPTLRSSACAANLAVLCLCTGEAAAGARVALRVIAPRLRAVAPAIGYAGAEGRMRTHAWVTGHDTKK